MLNNIGPFINRCFNSFSQIRVAKKMKIIRDRYYKHLKFIVFIYILASIVSYGYTIATGTYNGDFSGYVVSLSPIVLGGMLLFSLSPFIYLWSRYSYYKKKKSKYSVPVHIPFVEGVAIFLIIIRLFLFGICIQRGGKVSDLGWLLTVLESISPVIYIYIYFISSRRKYKIIVILLFLGEAFFKRSLNIVFSVGCLVLFCYYDQIKSLIKRHVVICFFLILSFPTIVAQLYILRGELRGNNSVDFTEKSGSEVLCDVLAGRLSSYANACFIIEDAVGSYVYAQSLPATFFQSRICEIYGIHLVSWPDFKPEKYLHVRYQNGNYEAQDSSTSLMLGIPGILIMSFLKSPWVFLLNIGTILLIIEVCFQLISPLNVPFANEIPVLLLLYPVLSGVSIELFFVVMQLIGLRILLYFNNKFTQNTIPI